MNLGKKKQLAAQVLGVGKNRIRFASESLAEIKEAITKQDIRDLHKEGFITIKAVKGRKKLKRGKTKRGQGKIKKKVNTRKQDYVKITRKLRGYLKELKNHGKISREIYYLLKRKIKMREFKSKAYLKDYLKGVEKINIAETKAEESKAERGRGKKSNKTKERSRKK